MAKVKFLSIIAIMFFFVSCGRYDDGPDVSLRSKAARLSGLWQVQKVFKDGQDVSAENQDYIANVQYGFYKDGNGIYFNSGWQSYFQWSFSSDKTEIKIVYTDNNFSETWLILRMTNKELWIIPKDNEDFDQINFIKLED